MQVRLRASRFARAAVCLGFCLRMAYGQTAEQATPGTLAVSGDVPKPLLWKADDLAKLPRETVSVTDSDGTTAKYEGVLLRDVLQRAGAPLGGDLRGKALTTYVIAKAHDGYQVVFAIGEIAAEFGNESILVADKRDGKPLTGSQGPFRLVCPNDKAGARSVRMLETLEVVRLQK
ncbi:MAG TPA: molybdopterin-dependent oxidoreductase [Bryobacteraceae bacterium]|nr:molybdopterin-dependent oxidoreductase [Bryobacteraceae bacterium]